MAKFIKIKSTNLNVTNVTELLFSADSISYVQQGNTTGTGSADTSTVFFTTGKQVTLTDTGQGATITEAINNALTANPGGVLAFVSLPSTVVITAIAVV